MNPRFERTGGSPDLERALQAFIVRMLRGRRLDDNRDDEAAKGKFPDFACLGDRLLIEMKHLEAEQKHRLQKVLDEKIDELEKPYFYGTRRSERIFENISNADEVKRALVDKLAKTIESQLRKANSQFESYKTRIGKKNVVTICIFLNSSIFEFGPDNFMLAVKKLIAARENVGRIAFPHIDAIILLSEKHFAPVPDGRVGFPIIIFEMKSLSEECWKGQFVDYFYHKWSEFRTGRPPVEGAKCDNMHFTEVEDIPDRMARHELWRLEYRRNPYLRILTEQQLRTLFNRNVVLNSAAFVKGSWVKPSMKETAQTMRCFTHIIEEINDRGIDMREMSISRLSLKEREFVFQNIPTELRALFDKKAA